MTDIIKVPPEPSKIYEGIQGGKYVLVDTLPKFNAFMEEAAQQAMLAVDTETTGLNHVFAEVCCIVIGFGVEKNFCIPVAMKSEEPIRQLRLEDIREQLNLLLGNPKVAKILWNERFDRHILDKAGIFIKGEIHDGLPLYHLLDENSSHALKDTSVKFIDPEADKWERAIDLWRTQESRRRRSALTRMVKNRAKEIEELQGFNGPPLLTKEECKDLAKIEFKNHLYAKNSKEDITYDWIPLELMVPYACADVHYTWLLFKKFILELWKDPKLCALYQNEIKLSHALFDAEHHGMKINADYLREVGPKFDEEIAKYQAEIYQAFGEEFNIDSDDELLAALKKMNIPLTKVTKGTKEKRKAGDYNTPAKYSVDKEVLQTLAATHDFAEKILKYREACKLKSTYVDGILELLDKENFVHPSFNANVTSGRLSCRAPNCQNIPSNNKSIRRAFIIPNDEYIFVFMDYSQVELRLTAHWSEDPLLLKCYPWEGEGTDVHTLTTANIVMDLPYDEVIKLSKDKSGHDDKLAVCLCSSCTVSRSRKIAKVTNFGIIYGAGAEALQRQISTPKKPYSKEQCQLYIDRYFDTYRGVKILMKQTSNILRKNKEIINSFGRRRRFPEYNNSLSWQKSRMERIAGNFLIQGDAADVFKHSVGRIYNTLEGKKSKLVNVVHDETQLYMHKTELDLIPQIKQIMEDFKFKVPLKVEVSYSENSWADKKELHL